MKDFRLRSTVLLGFLLIFVGMTVCEQEPMEDDVDLDLIDVNTPKLQTQMLEKYFHGEDGTIDGSLVLEMMYEFLLKTDLENLRIIEAKYRKGSKLKHTEQDILSGSHVIQRIVEHTQEKLGSVTFTRAQAKKILNREVYREYIENVANTLSKEIDSLDFDDDSEHDLDL